jgi:hypothetical protein
MAERKKEDCNSANVIHNKFYAHIYQKIHDDCHIKTLKSAALKTKQSDLFCPQNWFPSLLDVVGRWIQHSKWQG